MRGNVLDIFIILVMCFIVIAGFAFAYLFYTQISNEDSFEFRDTASAGIERSFDVFDTGMVLIIGASFVVLVFSGFYIQSHPVFFIVSLLIFIILCGLSFSMTNMFFELYSDPDIAASAEEFPYSLTLMGYAPYIFIFAFAVMAIVMFMYKPGRNAA